MIERSRNKKQKKDTQLGTIVKANNSPYDKIRERAEELEAISHPNEEQERLREVLWSIALRAHDGRTCSRLLARPPSHRQENQSQRRSTFKRLGPNGRHNRESRRNHSQSNQVEQPRESRSRVPVQTAPQNYSHQNDSWQKGGDELEYREAGAHDRFPCFASRLASVWLPHKFKPSNHSKYDGKIEPKQWLRIYSQSIKLAGGDDDIKALFFPMALETMPF
jgi:hypothetical protein